MWQLMKANFRKEFIELKRYYPNTIAMIVSSYFIFLAAFLGLQVAGNPTTIDENIQYTIVSMVFWMLALTAFGNPSITVLQEAMRGTLEQLYLNPYGAWRIMFSRIVAQISLEMFGVIILLFLAQLTSGQWLNLNPLTTIPIFLITFISLIGVGYMMAGLAMVFKQVQNFIQILQFILMGLVFIPLSAAPFLQFAPFVKGVNMIRDVMMANLSLLDFTFFDYLSLILNAIVYLVVGLFIYLQCEKIAMKKGLLAQY